MSNQESKDNTQFYTNKLAKDVHLGGPFIYCHLVRRLRFVLLTSDSVVSTICKNSTGYS